MALAATVIWEIRTTGSNNSGGGFDPALGGTDWSQQNAAEVQINNSSVTATVNGSVITFTGGTYTVLAGDVGNIVNITASTGGTAPTFARYEITSVSTGLNGTWTLDRTTGAVTATITAAFMGGATTTFASITGAVVAGNLVWIKASGTYSTSSNPNFATSGSSGLPISWVGYNTTRGDGGQVTVQATGNNLKLFTGTASYQRFYNIIADSNSKTTSQSWDLTGSNIYYSNCKGINFTVIGFNFASAGVVAINCVASGGTSAATAGFETITYGMILIGCRATGNACPGLLDIATTNYASNQYIFCIFDNNTGASSDGVSKTGANAGGAYFINCVFYNNGRDGLRLSGASDADLGCILNCIFVNNAGWGVNSNTTNWGTGAYTNAINFNAFYNNTSGTYQNLPAGANDVTLTGDPFVAGTSNNFALNTTAGAGASCVNTGYPGLLQNGGSGSMALGALLPAPILSFNVHETTQVLG
jgi:hypothetical protein